MTKRLLAAVALSAAPLLWPMVASAGILLTANGTTICSGPSGTACVNASTTLANGVIVQGGSANSNSPGTPAQADLFSSTVTLSNPTATTQTVTFFGGDTGFTTPTAPPGTLSLQSSIGGSVNTAAGANAMTYFSCVDPGNGQNNCTGTLNNAPVSPGIAAAGSYNATNPNLAIATLAAPFSMTEETQITLGAGAVMNFAAQSKLVPVAAPEPASLTLLGSALIRLGWLGRRRRKAV